LKADQITVFCDMKKTQSATKSSFDGGTLKFF
jgi:hypothetical protein